MVVCEGCEVTCVRMVLWWIIGLRRGGMGDGGSKGGEGWGGGWVVGMVGEGDMMVEEW